MLDAVTKGYLTLHPASAARILSRLSGQDAADVFSAMPRHVAGQVMERMAPVSACRCLLLMPPATASEVLVRTPLLAAVGALRVMGKKQVQGLLAQMPRPKAARIRFRLRFSEWVVGALVDEDVLTLSPDHRVGDALRLFRRGGQRTGQTIFVLDGSRRLVGIVDLCEMLGNTDRRVIGHLMQPVAHVLSARAALQAVLNHPAWLSNDALPVVNRNGVFQGVLRRSRVMEEESHMVSEIAERNELITTRTALADIFWLAVGALFVGSGRTTERDTRDG